MAKKESPSKSDYLRNRVAVLTVALMSESKASNLFTTDDILKRELGETYDKTCRVCGDPFKTSNPNHFLCDYCHKENKIGRIRYQYIPRRRSRKRPPQSEQ